MRRISKMIECRKKLMWEAHERYKKSTATCLRDVYCMCSEEKEEAFYYCLGTARHMYAYRYGRVKIIGWNSQTFSVGFYGIYNGELVFVYITKDNNRYINLADLMALEEKYGGCDD
jgi:hypothetical protein